MKVGRNDSADLHAKPYGVGLVIVLVDSVTAALVNTRPFTKVSPSPSVIAPADRMVPTHGVIGVPSEAEPTTQNTLVLAFVAVPPNTTVELAAGVNAPPVRMMYTPGPFSVKFT